MKANITVKIADLLKKELAFSDFALNRLKGEMISYEKEYSMTWKEFINKFEKGELGDDRVWFTWYGLAASARDWDDTKKEIKKTIGAS